VQKIELAVAYYTLVSVGRLDEVMNGVCGRAVPPAADGVAYEKQ